MYSIPDEPRPGRLAQWVVNPSWCLLSVMIGGAWLSWPWFLFNAWALGSPTKRRESFWVGGGFLGSVCFTFVALFGIERGLVPREAMPYLWLVLGAWKTTVSYILYTQQSKSFVLHEHFGGESKSGVGPTFVIGWLGSTYLLALLPRFWQIVLG